MVFHWSLSDNNSPQVSRTLLSILTVLNNAVVWMVSTRPPTSKSSSPFNNPLVTVPKAPIKIGIIVTNMFHSFFNFLERLRYLSFFLHSFSFIQWSAGTAKSTILQVLFFCCWLLLGLTGKGLAPFPTPHSSNYWKRSLLVTLDYGPGGNTPQGTNYTATCLPSRKLSKLDEPDTRDTASWRFICTQ